MLSPPSITPDRDKLLTLSKVLIGLFLLVGIALVYWSVLRAGALLARDDNPRRLEAAFRVQRGALLDAEGQILAQNEGPPERQRRSYPLPAGGHAVGFYSILHGTAGAEASFNSELSGAPDSALSEWWRTLQKVPQTGRDVQLALRYDLQETAVKMLDGERGAALLLELPRDGRDLAWVRALASAPGFDANTLDESFEELAAAQDAPLLDRVTQGQYQPGLLLQPFILAAAVNSGEIRLSDVVESANEPVTINGSELRCIAEPPQPATWADVLAYRCPAPMLGLADRLGAGGLDVAFSSFGLNRAPQFELDTAAVASAGVDDPLLAGIGQEDLALTPLQLGLAMGALAGDGRLPQPQLGAAIRDKSGEWQPLRLASEAGEAVTPATARAVRSILPQVDGVSEFRAVVLSGPAGSRNAWYSGIWHGEDADYVAIAVLENNPEQAEAEQVGRRLLALARESE